MTSLQETYVAVKGIIAENLESMGVTASSSDGLTTLAGKILDIEPSVSGLDLDTSLTLLASSSTTTVGSSITLTATLTASYDDETLVNVDLQGVLQNATIKFYEGSTLKGTSTTNSSGVATYTYTPTTGGNKTLKAVFDGTENFQDAESTGVSITVNKLSGSVTILPSSASVQVGNNATFSGVLNAGSGKQVVVTIDNTTAGEVTTTTDGAWTYTFQNLTVDTYSIGVSFAGDDSYTGATATASLTIYDATPVADSITLTADKSILSYADTESATLSATVLDENDDPIEGETVEFFNGSTSMGTATTNSSGVATKVYNSVGAGDVSFTAEVNSIVSEIFSLQDRTFYDASSSSNLSKYTIPSQMSMTYDSTNNCYSCTVPSAASGTDTVILDNLTLSNHCKIQADINMTNTSNNQPRIGLWNGNNGITSRVVISGTSTYFGISNQTKGNDGSNIEIHSGVNISTGNWYTLEVEYNNGSVTAKIYNGNTLIDTITGSESTLASTGNDFGIDIGFGRTANFKIKNIMIQEL